MSTILKSPLKPLEKPKYVDDGYNWEEGLSNEEEEQLYNAVPELWPLGKVALKKLYFLKTIDCGMFQLEEKPKYPIYFYKHQLGEVLILDEAADVTIKDKKVTRWTIIVEEQLKKLNLGNEGDPKEVLINAILLTTFQAQI